MASIDDRINELWDFDDPAASAARFRAAADEADADPDADADADERALLLTQLARALGLQGDFAEGHAVLDRIAAASPAVTVRVALERGRLLRSAGDTGAALPHFTAAAQAAQAPELEGLRIDALHMVALAVPADQRVAAHESALAAARACTTSAGRDWDASLLNNLGMVHADAGAWPEALTAFEEALDARRRIGDDERTRVARWMVAWALRNLGRRDEARAMQLALKAEHAASGTSGPYVDEELALLAE